MPFTNGVSRFGNVITWAFVPIRLSFAFRQTQKVTG